MASLPEYYLQLNVPTSLAELLVTLAWTSPSRSSAVSNLMREGNYYLLLKYWNLQENNFVLLLLLL